MLLYTHTQLFGHGLHSAFRKDLTAYQAGFGTTQKSRSSLICIARTGSCGIPYEGRKAKTLKRIL